MGQPSTEQGFGRGLHAVHLSEIAVCMVSAHKVRNATCLHVPRSATDHQARIAVTAPSVPDEA